jgi:GNAT superfamily N-acetyltransferase
MYSMDQLVDRVHWHLDPKHTNAKVWVIEDASGQIVAHAIARIERDEDGGTYGYFSTVYVAPEQRSQGLATRLLLVVEGWFRGLKMPRIIYNTAADHDALIRLFGRYGYRITHREGEMVQLTKDLRSAP